MNLVDSIEDKESKSACSLQDLIATFIKTRPQRSIVAELKGEDMDKLLCSFDTGHNVYSTTRMDRLQDAIDRLKNLIDYEEAR